MTEGRKNPFRKYIECLTTVPVAVEIKVVPVEAPSPNQLPVDILPDVKQGDPGVL